MYMDILKKDHVFLLFLQNIRILTSKITFSKGYKGPEEFEAMIFKFKPANLSVKKIREKAVKWSVQIKA